MPDPSSMQQRMERISGSGWESTGHWMMGKIMNIHQQSTAQGTNGNSDILDLAYFIKILQCIIGMDILAYYQRYERHCTCVCSHLNRHNIALLDDKRIAYCGARNQKNMQ